MEKCRTNEPIKSILRDAAKKRIKNFKTVVALYSIQLKRKPPLSIEYLLVNDRELWYTHSTPSVRFVYIWKCNNVIILFHRVLTKRIRNLLLAIELIDIDISLWWLLTRIKETDTSRTKYLFS